MFYLYMFKIFRFVPLIQLMRKWWITHDLLNLEKFFLRIACLIYKPVIQEGLGIRSGLEPQFSAREIDRAGLGLHFSSISGRPFGLRAGLARITAEKCHSIGAFGLLIGLRARLGLRKREKPGLWGRL